MCPARGAAMRRRGFGYAVELVVNVALAGAAGVYAFGKERPDEGGSGSYVEAVWWRAVVTAAMGSDYFPRAAGGACAASRWPSTPSPA
ncbi:MAG TPA: hypothetical protein VF668_11875 [Pyrinomonadaceae bacterium]|jgi:voltage-gated potassium channel